MYWQIKDISIDFNTVSRAIFEYALFISLGCTESKLSNKYHGLIETRFMRKSFEFLE